MPFTPRNAARVAVAKDNYTCPPAGKSVPSELFATDVFSMKVMHERLPRTVFKRLENAMASHESLNASDADVIASTMKDWAIERGATHYTHWFQPMTGLTAEKHDAFLSPSTGGHIINEFSGKMLIKGEPDASSFPSGGIRSTFEARGYTEWDPTSPAFLIENASSKTLYIPTVFLSYTGESLDRKTPLLRSLDSLSEQSLRILRLFGNEKASRVSAMVGAEQEYFLVDRRYFKLRTDLQLAGRTVYGAAPVKGQEMEDHYFGAISQRVLAFMAEVEERLLRLGVPAHTRHNEAAPGQFELAPLYEAANLATDHNMLVMEILRIVAEKHNFACLLHEKPFAGVNGSGKHNNWSLCDSEGNNLLDPGHTPHENAQFLVFLAAVLRAVHLHANVLRLATVGAGNDHRLGANEAPPAILSVFLGSQLSALIESVISGAPSGMGWKGGSIEIGVSTLPPLPRDFSDRNRTSPFAFTGNKFEFRAVGASMSVAPANICINVAVTNALDDIATELEAAVAKGKPFNRAVQKLLVRLYREHMPVVFNGNGYSAEWQMEAARRKLPNNRDSVSAIFAYSDNNVMDAFMRHGTLNERELLARQEILLEAYIKSVMVEAKLTLSMGRTVILPVALSWLKEVGDTLVQIREVAEPGQIPEEDYYLRIRGHIAALFTALNTLAAKIAALKDIRKTAARGQAVRDTIIPAMNECRIHGDALEELVSDETWPLPKYNELLWQH
jgi:Uncharacterized protein related to glutamine synthetase